MPDPGDPWERESRHGRQHSVWPEGYTTPDADLGAPAAPRRGPWQRFVRWLVNLIPAALSFASALLVLYLFAKLLGLR